MRCGVTPGPGPGKCSSQGSWKWGPAQIPGDVRRYAAIHTTGDSAGETYCVCTILKKVQTQKIWNSSVRWTFNSASSYKSRYNFDYINVFIYIDNHVGTDATQIFFLTLCHLQCCTCNTANIFAFSWKWSMRFLESWQILVLTFSQMRLLLYIFCYHQYVKKSVRFCPSADFPLLRLITVVTSHIGGGLS